VLHDLPEVAEWQPVWLGGLRAGELEGFRCAREIASLQEDIERAARRYNLQGSPLARAVSGRNAVGDARGHLREADRAHGRLRTGGLRQAFAGGRDLSDREWVLIAAAACEMHPAAVIKGAGLASIAARLDDATAAAAAAGVLDVPAIRVGDRVFHGDAELADAADAVRADQAGRA
jgi:2-hydroxychromene-2-carboxylate isomerase